MDRVIPSQTIMKKYREMGFNHHLILEAWAGCPENETIFLNTLVRIHSRDQLCSEQRLVWDGKRAPIKRIVNQTKLKKLSTTNYLQTDTFLEFMESRKKGLLSKKEYRGHRGLNLEYCGSFYFPRLEKEIIRRQAKQMKGYLRRLKYLSLKFDFPSTTLNILPLLKIIKHNFAGLVSLKLSLWRDFGWSEEDLHGFKRLFKRLTPTLRHLDLHFPYRPYEIYDVSNYPQALGSLITENLHRLETLCLNFGDLQFSISFVMFFINSACSRLPFLKKLNLQMPYCFVNKKWFLPQTNLTNNLRCLVLNFDKCHNLSREYLLFLQHDIAASCPALEELYIRLPNYKRFSGRFLSDVEEKLLQKLNLKRLYIERSLEEALDCYKNMRIEEMNEETTVEELFRKSMRRGLREEELSCFYEVVDDDQYYFDCDDWPDFLEEDYILEDLHWDQMEREKNELEEQEEAERVFRGELTREEVWEVEDEMLEMLDWYEEEKLYY